MARIAEVELPAADPLAREMFAAQEGEYGFVLNTSRVIGHRPTIMRGQGQLWAGIDASGLLDDGLKSLLCVRVASINGCPF
jgi:hypothetical protein